MSNDEHSIHLRQAHNPNNVAVVADLIKSHNPANLVQAYAQVGQGTQTQQESPSLPQQSSAAASAAAPAQPEQ